MNQSLKKGFSFGLVSGVITTLGLMVGLTSGTGSKVAVIGGILTISLADSFSDALGIHISEEARRGSTLKAIWSATGAAFITKFFFAFTFIIPVLIFNLSTAVFISLVWGLLVISVFSAKVAKQRKEKPINLVVEHVIISLVVVFSTYFLGRWVRATFS